MEEEYTGKPISFAGPNGNSIRGQCIQCKYDGLTDRGKIADFKLTVEGKSGATRAISLVETGARIKEKAN